MAVTGGGSIPPLNVTIRINTVGAKNSVGAMRSVTQASTLMTRNLAAGSITTRTLGEAMRQTASLMKYTLVGAFMNVGKQAIQLSRNFELTFSRIKGLVNVGADQIDVFRKRVLALASETGRAPQELADALYFITSSGVKDARALDILESSAKAAAAGLGETAVVSDALTSVLQAYGTGTYEASYATDILVAAVREGKAEADTFAPAFGKVLPVAAAVGARFEDVAAGIAALTRGGLSAGTSAIYIRQVLSQLTKPSKQAADALLSVGTSAEQIRTNIAERGLFPALQDLQNRIGNNTESFSKIFGNVRALTAVLSLLGPNAAENAEVFERLNNAGGDLAFAYESYADTLDKQFNQALAGSQAALIQFGNAIKPVATTLLNLSTAISSAVSAVIGGESAVAKITRNFLALGGGVIVAVAAFTAIFRTASSFIRLFSNFSQILQGTLFGVRGLTDNILAANVAQQTNTSITAQQQIAQSRLGKTFTTNTQLTDKFNKLSQAGRLTQQKAIAQALAYERINGQGIGSRLRIIALEKAKNRAVAEGNLSTAQATQLVGALGSRANITAASMSSLGIAMRFVAGAFSGILLASTLLTLVGPPLLKFFRGTDKQAILAKESLQGLNEVLDETAKYGESEIVIRARVSLGDAESETAQKRLQEQLGDAFFDRLEFENQANRGAEFAKATLLTVFGGVTESTRKELVKLFADKLDISAAELSNAILPAATGDDVADAIAFRATSNLERSLSNSSDEAFRNINIDPKQGIKAISDAVTQIFEAAGGDAGVGRVIQQFGNFGKEFADGINETGDFAPFIASLDLLNKEIENFDPAQKSAVQIGTIGGVLRNLSGDYELTSDAAGNFADVVRDKRNAQALRSLFVDTLGVTGAQATRSIATLTKELENVASGTRGASDAAQIFTDFFTKQIKLAGDAASSYDQVTNSLISVEQALQNVSNAFGDQVSEFETANRAIGAYTDGVRAVQGLTRSFSEQNDEVTLSLGDLSEAFADAGGNVLGTTENAIKFRSQFRDTFDEITKLAAIAGAQGDAEAADAILAAGQAQILDLASKYNVSAAVVQELFAGIGLASGEALKGAFATPTETAFNGGKEVGFQNAMGIKAGIESGQSALREATLKQAQDILSFQKSFWGIESPSRVMAAQVGVPLAQGISAGFSRETGSPQFRNIFGRQLVDRVNSAIRKAANNRKGFSEFAKAFLDAKKDVQTPVQDYIKAVVGRMRDVIGSLGAYIRSQLDFRRAQVDLLKLANTQRTLEAQRARTLREQAYAERRFGLRGGAEMTDYEMSRIDELQTAFERASRDYALGRATFTDVLDAEIALQEARASASEANTEVIDAQNSVIQAQADLETAALEFAAAQVGVLESYLDVQEAAINLYQNQKELPGVFNTLATAAGVTNGALIIGGEKIRDVGIRFGELVASIGVDLNNPEGAFSQALKGLGPTMWEAIKIGVQESLDKSPLRIDISKSAIVTGNGGGGNTPGIPLDMSLQAILARERARLAMSQLNRGASSGNIARMRAVGGPVSGMSPYMVGERGPEMFVPKVSGTIVTTSALERYTRVRNRETAASASGGNQIAVNVYNPVPEKASDSITRRMKVLSNSGLFG